MYQYRIDVGELRLSINSMAFRYLAFGMRIEGTISSIRPDSSHWIRKNSTNYHRMLFDGLIEYVPLFEQINNVIWKTQCYS